MQPLFLFFYDILYIRKNDLNAFDYQAYEFVMTKNARLFLMIAVSSLASQISLNMFNSGFILALSPLMMSIFLYLFKDLDPFRACCWMSLFSPLVRFTVELLKTENFDSTLLYVFPDVGFFLGFGIFFAIIAKSWGYAPYHRFYLRITLADFFGNCMEQTLRVILGLTTYSIETFVTFAVIAMARCFIVILVCIAADTYMSLLEKREHEENYKQLLLLASNFQSEVYSMRKNMNEIEDIMTNAFSLYENLSERDYPEELKDKALMIAKDIHEIKKGYRRVIQGLQDSFLADFAGDDTLPMGDILKIISVDVDRARDVDGVNLSFNSSFESNYTIQKYFAFMSIVGNFITNSIDALSQMPKSHRGEIFVRCRDMSKEGKKYCVIEIKDNGPGIPEEDLEYIYVPGFSTKFNETTGDIKRGVGLTLAKDLLEAQFDGNIEVKTDTKGTRFLLWFPVEKLTENVNSYSDFGSSIASEDNVEQYESTKSMNRSDS